MSIVLYPPTPTVVVVVPSVSSLVLVFYLFAPFFPTTSSFYYSRSVSVLIVLRVQLLASALCFLVFLNVEFCISKLSVFLFFLYLKP